MTRSFAISGESPDDGRIPIEDLGRRVLREHERRAGVNAGRSFDVMTGAAREGAAFSKFYELRDGDD
jgi:hypothetical protein